MKLKQSGHLTRYERGTLVSMRSSGKSFREIAKYLGINVSTVSREFKRNKLPVYLSAHSSIREKADWMHDKAEKRKIERIRKKRSILENNELTQRRVLIFLKETSYSPEKIANIISSDDLGVKLSGKSIRRWINKYYPDYRKYFPHRGKRPRKCLTSRRYKTKKAAAEKRNICNRNDKANNREELGHLELDMIVCSQSSKAILSIRDRKSRKCYLDFVQNLQSKTVKQAIIRFLNQYPLGVIKTMTFDRGSEFAQVHHLENRFNLLNYFCDAYCSWQKGSVENQNKEVRVYIRKGTNLEDISLKRLKEIELLINTKPRDCLDGLSSDDVWFIESRSSLY